MTTIDTIIEYEWDMFTNATNAGGRASCQDDRPTFLIMRRAQHEIWAADTLDSYLRDLEAARAAGVNLVAIKYARMMKITFPDEYDQLKDQLPPLSAEVERLAAAISAVHTDWALEAHARYPKLAQMGRPLNSEQAHGSRWAAIDNYLHSELLTYSEATLRLCLRDTEQAKAEGRNLAMQILENTARLYGYSSLDEVEARLR